MADERRNMERETRRNYGRGESPDRPHRYGKLKCWHCGQTGHVRNKCPNRTATAMTGVRYGKSQWTPSVKIMKSFRKVAALPADAPL